LEVFLSFYAAATPYAVRLPIINLEYSTPLFTPMLPPNMPSRSLEAISEVKDIDVESKFTNVKQ
jgi:hypothetical protein